MLITSPLSNFLRYFLKCLSIIPISIIHSERVFLFSRIWQAREALSERYMGTVQSRFLGYMNRITGQAREQIFVTPELEVTMERLGEPRSMEYFSAGQTDIVTLCMRLALVDALFEDTTPLVILDDPFVNLDDGSLKQALTVLQELARDHQILYLVCNSGRSL